MDSCVNAALEEICAQVEDGLTLEALWPKLEASTSATLSPAVKKAIWTNLLRIPTLRFEPHFSNPNLEFEDAQNLNLKIFAQQSLSDNFLGLYDSQSLQNAQLRVLQLLANARHNGITQSQLAKNLCIDPNNFFYVLRSLECQGLVLKRPAIEKKRQIGDSKSSYIPVNTPTHLVYLHRYAKQIASHQRFEFEITEFNDPDHGTASQTDVLLKDYEPQMKAICDKLANANGKVLLVSDLRRDLGYSGPKPRQRAWKQIFGRLKAHHMVDQFVAKVNGETETCLRLLDPITTGSGNEDKNTNSGKICQVTDQFVELPIEHQIFDIIDAAGSYGITIKEICERLGIELKKNHIRLINLCYRFGMKVQEEQCLKSKTIRVWTSRNFNPELETGIVHKLDQNKALDQHVLDSSSKTITDFEASSFNGEHIDPAKFDDVGTGAKPSRVSPKNVEPNSIQTPTTLAHDQSGTISHSKSVSLPMEADVTLPEAFSSDVVKPLSTGLHQRCASLSFTVDGTKRENRILERLKDERFLLRPDITRWLGSFEKDKSKKLDRKTVDGILDRLQKQGLCKCITVHSPLISDYSRTKDCIVVVHPSISLSPELFDEIRDKVRSFNNYIRSKSISHQKNDESIPIMEDIQKAQSLRVPDRQAGNAEAMRANGFILAKMVRAKLLHSFLWDYLHRSASHSDALSSNELTSNPHSSGKQFSLEAAIKAISVELFLQVVGSTKKYEEMIEKCKRGSCLSDLPPEEYKCLMDTHATRRLSLVIDILRRLKLIRVITSLQSMDGVKTPHTLTHMMELRPYIEEPLSNDAASLNFISLDLRPRIRHDFILSNRDAVDEYWRTLEYCYASDNKKAALYAFPGSVVREVHSMYYGNRRHCLNQFNDEETENNSLERKSSSSRCKRKNSPELRPAKRARIDAVTDVDMHIDEQPNMGLHSGEKATHTHEYEEANCEIEDSQEWCPRQCILTTMKPPRQRRFKWSEKTDRQLVIQYVRNRAALGAKYHRTDWVSLSGLPAPPSVCKRRMNFLNGNLRFRKSVNKLCNILTERYATQMEKSQHCSSSLNKDDCRLFVRSQSSKVVQNSLSSNVEIQMTSLDGEAWDDFENKSIRAALDEILRCKMMAKLDASSQKVQSQDDGWSVADAKYDGQEEFLENEKITSAIPCEIIQSHCGKTHTFSYQRSRCRLDMKFTRFLNNKPNVYGQVYESLAVSNAVELFKLIFLSTATGTQASSLIADILRHYSEHDLFAAFNYLREKKIMVGGDHNERFELSLQFLHGVSKSPFPFDTGNRAIKFSAWLQERNKDLTEMGTYLTDDLQCGDIFHLFALTSSGELSISPSLPDSGIGEADDLRSAKRKSDVNESFFSDKAKKPKFLFGGEGEIISRREKGFPGIIISTHRPVFSRADIIHFEGNLELMTGQSINYSLTDHMRETLNSCDLAPVEETHIESPWEAMVRYVRRLMSVPFHQEQECAVCVEVFRVVYAAIQKAGDQGLSMGEMSQVINLPRLGVDRLIVDALQAFGKALKVNAYDSVRIVDALYRHKYFLTRMSSFHQGVVQPSSSKALKKSDVLRDRNTGFDNVHRVTILNHPHGDVGLENQACDRNEGCMRDRLGSSRGDHEKEMLTFSSGVLCVPILPWINGDGTINNIVYKGLRRRVLGIVMQNPGILEDDILRQMHVLNPQSCRTFLELMVLDKHLQVRRICQNSFVGGRSILQDLIERKSCQSKLIYREHFFANPMSTSLL